jgi:hypothetical protein
MNIHLANIKSARLTMPGTWHLACVVCAAPLPLSAHGPQCGDGDNDYSTCSTVACRMVVGRRAAMEEASFKQYLQIQARQTQQRLLQTRALQLRNQAEALENEAGWAALRALNAGPAAPDPSPALMELELLLPTGPQRRSKLPERRRQRYRAHLLRIIAEAQTLVPLTVPAPAAAPELQTPSVADSSAPPEATLSSNLPGRLCGLCGGGCCTSGGDTAYLSAATIQRVLAQQPDLQADQLLDAYLAYLPGKPQTDSCVNHGAQGCTLPRALRADICNDYVCQSLARVESALEAASQATPAVQIKIFVVQRQQDHWHGEQLGLAHAITGLAVMDAAGTDKVPMTAPVEIRPIR